MRGWIRLTAAAIAITGAGMTAKADQAECRVQGDREAQVARCSEVIASASSRRDRAVAYLYRCQAQDLLGRHRKALEDCLTAADLNPNDAAIFNSLNIVYRNLGRFEDSVAAASTAIRMRPLAGAAFAGRAASYCTMGRYAESYEDRLQAIEIGYLEVVRVQRFLSDRGFYAGEIDGDLGSGSRAALRAWTDGGC